MLIDRRTIRAYPFWPALAAGLLAASAVWYAAEFALSEPWRLPGGSSRVGFGLGIAAGLIFLFEFLYWPRKFPRVRAWQALGRAEAWLRAHIWLGAITLPLVLLHSGFSTGGWFTTVFFGIFIVVYASGLFGLAMQQIIPRWLLDLTPEETIHSQIGAVMRQHLRDAERLVATITGDETVYTAELEEDEEAVLVGQPRRVGTVREKVRYRADVIEAVPHAEALRDAMTDDIRPFLLAEPARHARLGTPGKSAEYFAELRRRVPAAAHDAVTQLERICNRHRQLRLQQRLYFWLHGWLTVHLPLSVALMIFLVVHIVTALQYSGIPLR